jgi:hypothetical protein
MNEETTNKTTSRYTKRSGENQIMRNFSVVSIRWLLVEILQQITTFLATIDKCTLEGYSSFLFREVKLRVARGYTDTAYRDRYTYKYEIL